jgi:hypothetical protein
MKYISTKSDSFLEIEDHKNIQKLLNGECIYCKNMLHLGDDEGKYMVYLL